MYDPTISRFYVADKKINPLKSKANLKADLKDFADLEIHLKWKSCRFVCGNFSEAIPLNEEERSYLQTLYKANLRIERIEAGILEKIKQAFRAVSKKAAAILVGIFMLAGTAKGGTAFEKKADELTNLYRNFAKEQTYSEIKIDHKIVKDSPGLKVIKWTFKDSEGKIGSIELTLTENLKDLKVSLDSKLDAGVYSYVKTVADDLQSQIKSP